MFKKTSLFPRDGFPNDEENDDNDDAIDDVGQRTDGIPRPTER